MLQITQIWIFNGEESHLPNNSGQFWGILGILGNSGDTILNNSGIILGTQYLINSIVEIWQD